MMEMGRAVQLTPPFPPGLLPMAEWDVFLFSRSGQMRFAFTEPAVIFLYPIKTRGFQIHLAGQELFFLIGMSHIRSCFF